MFATETTYKQILIFQWKSIYIKIFSGLLKITIDVEAIKKNRSGAEWYHVEFTAIGSELFISVRKSVLVLVHVPCGSFGAHAPCQRPMPKCTTAYAHRTALRNINSPCERCWESLLQQQPVSWPISNTNHPMTIFQREPE